MIGYGNPVATHDEIVTCRVIDLADAIFEDGTCALITGPTVLERIPHAFRADSDHIHATRRECLLIEFILFQLGESINLGMYTHVAPKIIVTFC